MLSYGDKIELLKGINVGWGYYWTSSFRKSMISIKEQVTEAIEGGAISRSNTEESRRDTEEREIDRILSDKQKEWIDKILYRYRKQIAPKNYCRAGEKYFIEYITKNCVVKKSGSSTGSSRKKL